MKCLEYLDQSLGNQTLSKLSPFCYCWKCLKNKTIKWGFIPKTGIYNMHYGHLNGRRSNYESDSQLIEWQVEDSIHLWIIIKEHYTSLKKVTSFPLKSFWFGCEMKKLWTPKSRDPNMAFFRLPLGKPKKNEHFDLTPMGTYRV